MRKINDRVLAAITSVILVCIAAGITAACFLPDKEMVVISLGGEYSPLYGGDRNGNGVALMFNVYEGTETVEGILEVLEEKGARATFFVGGCWADDNAETLVKILENGNELAVHGYFHKDHSKLDEKGNRDEILSAVNLVKKLTGEDVTLFAPPSGAFSETTLEVAAGLGLKTIMWSKDTVDWRDKSSSLVFTRATKNVAGGDFILMHPKEHTLAALGKILDYYASANLKAVTVTECINGNG